MRRVTKYVLAVFCLSATGVVAQNTSRLQQQLKENQRQIDLTREVLKETLAEKKASLKTLSVYKTQIALQQEELLDMTLRMNELEVEIEDAKEEISGITAEIERLKSAFSEAVVNGYKNDKRMSKLHYYFMSNSFNDLLKRMEYLKRVMDFRKMQLELIEVKKAENSQKINALNKRYSDLSSLHEEREEDTKAIKKDQELYASLVKKLQAKETQLNDELEKRKARTKELERLIREEIKKSEQNTARRNVTPAPAGSGFTRGNLPWPVDNGYISETFGRHKHTDFKNVTTQNNGINIICERGSNITCIYPGVVSAVIQVPGMQTSVLVKHEGYYTVYANLSDVSTGNGAVLKQGDVIGKVGLNNSGIPELHFEIWEGTVKLNPALWIRK